MCGGGGGGGSSADDIIEQQKRDEEARKRRIEEGRAQINRIFAPLEGDEFTFIPEHQESTLPVGRTEFADQLVPILSDPNAIRETTGTRTERRFFGGASQPVEITTHGYKLSPRAVQAINSLDIGVPASAFTAGPSNLSQAFDAAISGANNTFSLGRAKGASPADLRSQLGDFYGTFSKTVPDEWVHNEGVTEPIWEQQRQAYLDFANPQLQQQYDDARRQLGFALAQQGQTSGTVRGEQMADLQRQFGLQQQEIAQKARDVANRARGNIADQKQSLINMLSATGDKNSALDAARQQFDALSAMPSFSNLGPLFTGVTSGLANAVQGNNLGQMNQRIRNQLPQAPGVLGTGAGRIIGG